MVWPLDGGMHQKNPGIANYLSLGNSVPIANRTGGFDLAMRVSGERDRERSLRFEW